MTPTLACFLSYQTQQPHLLLARGCYVTPHIPKSVLGGVHCGVEHLTLSWHLTGP